MEMWDAIAVKFGATYQGVQFCISNESIIYTYKAARHFRSDIEVIR